MASPWRNLPSSAPFVLREDMEAISRFNAKNAGMTATSWGGMDA